MGRSGPHSLAEEAVLARTKVRHHHTPGEEVRRWREGLSKALTKPPRKRRRLLRYVALGLVFVVVAGLGAGYMYWRVISGLFARTDVSLQPAAGGALNVLLVGSDSRADLNDPDDLARFGSVGGKRADTILLAQLIPSEQRGVLLSFPRDLYVPVHAEGRQFQSKINAAYAYGPQAMIDTVAQLSQIPINHYMEIDFGGFRRIVDAIGGIEICQEQPLYDRQLNFRLPEGVSHLDGNAALSFVRSRYSTPDGDFGRIRRQQQFIRAVMSSVGKPSVLGNPIRVNELARAFAQNVTVDQFFQLDDLVRFALSVRRVGPDQLKSYAVPGRTGRAGGQSVVLMDTGQADLLFGALRLGEDPAGVVPAAQAMAVSRPAWGMAPGLLAQSAACPPAV